MSCPICNLETTHNQNLGRVIEISCPRCGNYSITGTAEGIIRGSLSEVQIANISHWIVTNNEPTISTTDIVYLSALPTPTVGEKARRFMLFLSKKYPKPGEYIKGLAYNDPFYYSLIGCYDAAEFSYILKSYLEQNQHYLMNISTSAANKTLSFSITPNGWAYIESLKDINPDSHVGFIAMWFDPRLDRVYVIVSEAIADAGYKPVRIDNVEHNNDINDEIIATIRQSRFVVADFTRQRGGVYFEAGYAKGLGLEVVWLYHEYNFKKVHFDTNHYSFILWKKNTLDTLKEKLTNRIIATIGKGTYNP